MGTVAEKLTYLNGTKSSLKTAINNLGGDITSSTTFRNYATELNTIYDNLPKVSDTGTNVSLSPTLKGRLGIVPKGNTYQESTTGKNLFDVNNVQRENSATLEIITNGFNVTRTHSSGFGDEFIASYTIEGLDANTIYTLNLNVETENNYSNGSIYVYSDNLFGTALTKSNYSSSGNNHKWNITTSSNGKMVIGFYATTTTQNKMFKFTNIQLEKGSTATSYEPYTGGQPSPSPDYPQEIQSATGTQKVVVSGKNLLDTSGLTEKTQNGVTITPVYESGLLKYININGTFDGSSNYSYRVATLNVTNGTTYYMSGVTGWNYNTLQLFANSSQAFPSGNKLQSYNGETSREALADETISIGLYVYAGQTYNNVKVYPMVSLSSSSYQPYQEPQEVDIELGNIELNKIGDYEDYIGGTPDNWVLYKRTRKVELAISDMNNNEDYPGWKNVANLKTDYVNKNTTLNTMTNFKANITKETDSGVSINTTGVNSTLYLRLYIFNLTQTQWKEQYPNLVFELVYGLQEYEQTPITEEALVSQLNELYYLQSYNDTTNIDVTGNLPMRITASAIKGA